MVKSSSRVNNSIKKIKTTADDDGKLFVWFNILGYELVSIFASSLQEARRYSAEKMMSKDIQQYIDEHQPDKIFTSDTPKVCCIRNVIFT